MNKNKNEIWGMRRDYPDIWYIWKGMLERCRNPHNKAYKNYGAKGIKVCEAWLHCNNFLEFALIHGFQKGYSIDRIDSSKDYEPANCRFIPISNNVIRSNKARKGIKLTQYNDEICLQIIDLLINTDLSYRLISQRLSVPVGLIADINQCHTHKKLHNYKYNIRQESVTTNRDECSDVE